LDKKLILVLIAIIALGITLRIIVGHNNSTFFEPDVFYYFSVIKATIASGHIISPLSGFPQATIYTESPMLIYYTTSLYSLLGGTKAPINTALIISIMHTLPLVAFVIEAILAYLIVTRLIDNKWIALLAVLFLSVSVANISKSMSIEYRGDSFISVYLMLALYLTILIFTQEPKEVLTRKKLLLAFLAGGVLAFGLASWNGGDLLLGLYFIIAIIMIFYNFIKANRKELLNDMIILLFIMVVGWICWNALISFGLGNPQALSGLLTIYAIVALVVATLIAYWLSGKITSEKKRILTAIGIGLLFIIGLYVIGSGFISNNLIQVVTHGSGQLAGFTEVTNNVFVSNPTIAETAPASFAFLFSSFQYDLALCWFGIFGIFYIKRSKIDIRIFLMLLSYFVITFILTLIGSRWSSLLSIPMAIFGALGIFVIAKLVEDKAYLLKIIIYGILAMIICAQVFGAIVVIWTTPIGDGINHQTIQAMDWLSQNTPKNSTVLALWPDGSIVEGIGNRTAWTDSVGNQNSTKIEAFSIFLLNTSPDPQYLINIHPDYLYVRQQWKQEELGIALERTGLYPTNLPVNVINASANMFKLLNGTYTAQNLSLQKVFNNNDSIIYKVNYNAR
jgi:asparagine N-glycosylation enzyme membrane subunit Stt3